MNLNLTGKRAIVCGSTQGIGKAAAIELASLGASITLIARNEEKLKQVMAELPQKPEQVHNYITTDFNYTEDLKSRIGEFVKNSKADILINNTGGPAAGQAIDAASEDYIKAFSNHLVCNQILVQALVPGMKASGWGRIINIISTSVKTPLKGLGVSNTIRGAVASWSKTLSFELAPFGITVNNILPGFTMTGRLESLIENRAEKENKTPEQVKNEMIQGIPAGRIGEAHETAAVISFLASPAAGYINGTSIPVDGGSTPSI